MGAMSRRSQEPKEQQPYRCFLVRCRLEAAAGQQGESAWRFTVQQTGPDAGRRSFACLHDVAAHLEAELSGARGRGDTGTRRGGDAERE